MIIKSSFILAACMSILLSGCNNSEKSQQSPENDAETNTSNGMMHEEMMSEGMMQGEGMMSEEMQKAMMSEDMGAGMMEDMRTIRNLLMNHEQINRKVENLENGVKTWTESDDPEIASAIRTHVRQMKERIENQQPIRQMDPLFRELFDHADKIEMQIEDTANGVVVIETSEDPDVVKMIQQHANRAVSEFVEQGMQRAMQPTPLPEGYEE